MADIFYNIPYYNALSVDKLSRVFICYLQRDLNEIHHVLSGSKCLDNKNT